MDVEAIETEQSRNDLQLAVRLAARNDILLCLSNPAFEVWFLAHFVRTSRRFNDCDAVVLELDKHWSREFHLAYSKNDDRIYLRIADRTQTAITNAKLVREQDHGDKLNTVECNFSTDMYRLVEYLLKGLTNG